MAILVQCPSCGVSSPAADSFSGRSVRCKKCGNPFVAQPTLDGSRSDTQKSKPLGTTDPFPTLPAEFGRYRVLRLLGKGGMGAVYLAKDSQLGREVALKIPFFDAKESPQRAERFVREAQSAAALHHPNICTVFDAGRIAGTPFMTMAFVAGTPLDRAIDPDALMPQTRAAEIARNVALALAHAHGKGIVHRDLKPANVMLDEGGEPVVMDFGLAKRGAAVDPNEAKLTRDGGILGTPSYMSPEQVRGDTDIGPATDVYSLGVLLFEMLAGHTPYSGGVGAVMGKILAAPVPPLAESRPDADPQLDAICQKAMAKSPGSRFPSMAAFAQTLGDYLHPANPTVSVELVEPAAPQKPVPAVVAPAPVYRPAPAPFDELTDEAPPVRRSAKKKPTPAKAAWNARRIGIAAGIALAVMIPAIWLGSYLLRVETPNGTLIVEVADDEVEAKIKGGKLVLSGPDGKVRYTLSAGERDKKLDPGAYKIRVEGADGLVLDTPDFTLKKGDKVTVRVTLEKKDVAKKEPNVVEKEEEWISLSAAGLTEWLQDGTDWQEVKSVALDSKNDSKFVVEAGTGTLYCSNIGNSPKNLSSKRRLGDFELQADFLVSKQGNSGLFFHSHYELQVCDSFGVAVPRIYDCGGVFPCHLNGAPVAGFGVAPKENMSRKPG